MRYPSKERLFELFEVNVASGTFLRRLPRGGRKAGEAVGCPDKNGYTKIRVDDVLYNRHILVWIVATGSPPTKDIDHINTDKHDDRFENLRLASKIQNGANRSKNKNNTSGLKGVYYDKRAKEWRASLIYDGKRRWVARGPCRAAVHLEYVVAANKLHGEFARA